MKLNAVAVAVLAIFVHGLKPSFAADPLTEEVRMSYFEDDSSKVENGDWQFSVGTVLMSTYYGTIFGGNFYDGPMSFTDFNAAKPNGLGVFNVNVAIGQKLNRITEFNMDGGNEYDLAVSQIFTFGPKAFPMKLEVGLSYLAIYDLNLLKNDAFSETVRFDLPILADRANSPIVQPYAQVYHYHDVGGMRNQGWIGYVGLIRDQPLGFKLFEAEKNLVLNWDYRLGLNGGVYGSRAGVEYHRISVSLPVSYGKWTFTPSIIGQFPGGADQRYVKEKEVFGTLSVRRGF